MTLRLVRPLALVLLLATGSGCASRQAVGGTIAGLGAASVAVALDSDSSAGQAVASTDQDTRVAFLFSGAAAVLVGTVIALAPSRRPARPTPVTTPAVAPESSASPAAPSPGPISPDAPAPDAPGTRGDCPPQAVCLPMTP